MFADLQNQGAEYVNAPTILAARARDKVKRGAKRVARAVGLGLVGVIATRMIARRVLG